MFDTALFCFFSSSREAHPDRQTQTEGRKRQTQRLGQKKSKPKDNIMKTKDKKDPTKDPTANNGGEH